jgi:hypothetical protein
MEKKIISIRWELHKLYDGGYTLDQMQDAVRWWLEDGLIDVEEIIKALVSSRFMELSQKEKVEDAKKILSRILL